MRSDYTTIGHVTVDVLADGSRRPGGTAFYSALQAARLGLRARILTRGRAEQIERMLAPFLAELELDVIDAEHTTTLLTNAAGQPREQRLLAWAGEIDPPAELRTQILHLAPVARETPAHPHGHWSLLGLTPQGLVREWQAHPSADAAPITLGRADASQLALAARCNALVLSELERRSCAQLIHAARAAGATIAITAAGSSKTLLLPDARELRLAPAPVGVVRDDIGAGDVFAAAFFIGLHERRDVREAARFASAAAALRLEGDGAGAIASREQIEHRLARSRSRRHVR